MKSKDLKSLLLKLNNHLIQNLDTATGMGIKRNHYEITVEHLFIALLENGQGDVPLILKHYALDPGKIQELCYKNLDELERGNSGRPRLSPTLTDLLEQAWYTSSVHLKENKIRSGALFEVFIASEWVISTGLLDILGSINQEQLRNDFHAIVTGSAEDMMAPVEALPAETAQELPSDATVLDLYTTNLTAEAKAGKIDPILGRENEMIQMIEVLSRRKKSNPILLGEPGVGKTAVVEGLALKVAADQVPDILKNVRIHALDLGALQAGTKMRGEFEKRLKAVLKEVTSATQPIILFIDEAHTLIGAGSAQGSSDAANLLKPALARGEFRAIAATTYLEYNKYFAKDAALERRFQPIHIGEPEDETAMVMIRGIKKKYEQYHGIHISDEAIEAAVKLSRRYIAGRQLPDKAVDLLDTGATRVKMSLTSKPPSLTMAISDLQSLELQIEMMQQDQSLGISDVAEQLKEMQVQKEGRETEIKENEEKWLKECELTNKLMLLRQEKLAASDEQTVDNVDQEMNKIRDELSQLQGESPQVFADVTAVTIAQIIESWTGIPVSNMTRDEMTTLLNLGDELRHRVVGQDHAIQQIADVIRGAKVGLKKEEGPIGVFLLIGPSGVGKTELARTVAEALFGDERFMVTLNMTEYQNEYNTSRLIGADPGLVGYGEGGALSEPVRRRPYSVVLLDEIEKANPAVMDLFMQIFDRGLLQDADRRTISFNNTIIFMTSNLASEVLFEKYLEGITSPEDLLEELRPYMNRYFRPEFLGRIKPIVFLPLGSEVLKQIVNLKLGHLVKRLEQNQKLHLQFSEEVVDDIVASCTRGETGARNVDAIIDRKLAPEISAQLLGFMVEGEAPSNLVVNRDELGNFSYTFS
ncbi:type VI secretion system ATPase TssH [candidate division CSSED10-310 bacterium]|uniref:Type VI secretion system ATPase TssH n=1 Tax=candidate division CSSED10-310 bacterium TaxID=2855610 RepID=A0ABV6Z0U0_UNCC1